MYLQFCVFPFVLIIITLSMKSMQSFLCEKEFEKMIGFVKSNLVSLNKEEKR